MARWPSRNTITQPKLILCEGGADEAFLRALIAARSGEPVSIRNTADRSTDPATRGGVDRFGALLEAVSVFRGFEIVTDIMLVADSDDDPVENFARLRHQIAKATNQNTVPHSTFGVPEAPARTAAGQPSITVLLVPWHDETGNLESLCLPAAETAAGAVAKCVADFAECIGADEWPRLNAIAKLKLRTILAARHRPDPFLGLGTVWMTDPTLIPLNHQCFDRVWLVLDAFLSRPARNSNQS